MAQKDILFPIGRMIGGSTTNGDDTDSKGQKRIIKTGPNAGQPFMSWSFGVAIPKGPETSWTQTPWGAQIYAAGIEGYPNGEVQRPDFSWKVIDGDSQIPNKKLKKPCDQQGYPGNWVIWFSSGAAPKQYDIIGNKVGDAPRALSAGMEILPGYYIQVFGSAKDNKPSETPGVYLNHSLVALAGYGERITQGPDANEVGFGGAALPPGASTVPTAGMVAPTPAAVLPPPVAAAPIPVAVAPNPVAVAPNPAILAAPPAPAPAPPPPVAAAPIPVAVAPNPVAVAPNPAILAAPPAPAPAPPPPAPAAPARVMIGAYTYDQLVAAGYSDAQMVAQGYMQA